MGMCCGKSAMPVIDDAGRQHRTVAPQVTIPPVPTVEFDIVVPEGGVNLASSFARGGPLLMDQSIHTVSDCSFSMGDGGTHSLSGTLREDMSRSFVTNGLSEVLSGHIEQFVNGVLQLSASDPHNILEESFSVTASSMRNRGRGSFMSRTTRSFSLTKEQLRYLEEATNTSERLSRLVELEQMSRQEIFGAWKMNTTLFQLALRRIIPTIRQFKIPPREQRKKGNARDVLVIHAKDIELQFDEDGSKRREESQPGASENSLGPPLFSPRGDREENENKKVSPPVAEHYQMLALTAREISITASVQAQVVNDTWDFLSLPNAANHLNAGNVFFRFVCSPVSNLERDSLDLIDTFINLTSFADEVQENNVPKIDIFGNEQHSKYVTILVKAMYLLPGVRMSQLTTELLASLDYQRNCQPGDNKFESPDTPYTFRTVKTIIKFVFSITIQMKVSEITDPDTLRSFKDIDGMIPAKVLLLERTKKNIQKTDSTVKVRSLLLYYPVNDGVLVNNQTIVLNSSMPRVISSMMQSLGSQGASEAAQTAKLTRQYMIHRFGDSRS